MADDLANKIERSRQRREDELLLLLLLLSDDARRDSIVALRHDLSVDTVLQNTFAKAMPLILASMEDAHRDAFSRFGKLSDEPIARANAGESAAIQRLYESNATQASLAMASSLGQAIREAQATQIGTSAKQTVNSAFETAGYTKANPSALDAGVERAIVSASNVGMIHAARMSGRATALRHISVMDEHTTEICDERHELTLPVYHPYWRFNVPQLHWRCRSMVIPIFGEFVASEFLPVTQPMAGFGLAPAGFLEAFNSGAAA
jgi:hypothetical protein